ncbi:hypothetical protein JHK85_008347 [Glycine max]|nr:hypothetical protein JHK85_008347 [Glycine max]
MNGACNREERGFWEVAVRNSSSNPADRHELVRRDVKQVICSVCDTEQEVAKVCSSCGVNMGEYYCEICKFYDDDVRRIKDNSIVMNAAFAGACYSVSVQNNHSCVENSMKSFCPICLEVSLSYMLEDNSQ